MNILKQKTKAPHPNFGSGWMVYLLAASSIFFSWSAQATLLTPLSISGKDGGNVDGSAWSSSELKGKISFVLYVDPGKRNLNKKMQNGLKDLNLNPKYFQSFAIVNLAASWIPNRILQKAFKRKKIYYTNTKYVLDKKKYFVQNWGLPDKAYYLMITNQDSRVVYVHEGKFDDKESQKLYYLVREQVKQLEIKSLKMPKIIPKTKKTQQKIHLYPYPKSHDTP